MLVDPCWDKSAEKVDMNQHMAAYYSNWNTTLGIALQLEMKHRSQPLKINCALAVQLTMAWDVKVSLKKGKEAWLLKGKGWTGSFFLSLAKSQVWTRGLRGHMQAHITVPDRQEATRVASRCEGFNLLSHFLNGWETTLVPALHC